MNLLKHNAEQRAACAFIRLISGAGQYINLPAPNIKNLNLTLKQVRYCARNRRG